MRNLGPKAALVGGPELVPVTGSHRLSFTRPDLTPHTFPDLPDGMSLVCGLDTLTEGEQLVVCESLADMQDCDSIYGSGHALGIHWYFATVVDAAQN